MADYYFIDTREGAKEDAPFAIHNADVAKVWTRDYNNGEGPFKPVDTVEYTVNRRDLKEAGETTEEKQVEAVENNAKIDEDNPYKEMKVEELQDELDARGVKFKSKATKAELIALLLEDDNN